MLTGRDGLLAEARTALVRADGAVLIGPAGVGRTALARAVVADLTPRLFAAVWITATEASKAVPFGALGQLLAGGHPALHPALVHSTVRASLAQRCGATRTPVLVIDDAHLLDGPSAGVLLGLVQARAVRALVTVRSGVPAPDAVVALWKDVGLPRLVVPALAEAEVGALAEELLTGPVSRSTTQLLWQWTGGLPHLAVALIDHGREVGSLARDTDQWRWRAGLAVPAQVADLLDGELDRIGRPGEEALAALALGGPLPLSVVEAAASPDLLADLEQLGMVRSEERGQQVLVRLRDPMLGAAVRRRMSPARRRRVSAALLTSTRQTTLHGPHEMASALWAVHAGQPIGPPELVRSASLCLYADPAASEQLARRAWQEGGGASAAVALSAALVEQGRTAEAYETLRTAERDAEAVGDRAARVTVGMALAGHRTWVGREPRQAYEDLRRLRADAEAAGDSAGRAELAAVGVVVELFSGEAGRALHRARQLLGESLPRGAHLRVTLASVAALVLTGRTEEAVRVGRAAVAALERSGSSALPQVRGMAGAALALAELWRQPTPTGPVTDPAAGRWPLPPDPLVSGLSHTAWPLFDGYAQRVSGDRTGAISRLRDAVAQQTGGTGMFRSEATGWLAVTLAEDGRPDEAEAVLREHPVDAVALVPGLRPWALAAIAEASGRRVRAGQLMDEAIVVAHASGCWLVELGYLIYAAHLEPVAGPARYAGRIAEAIGYVDAERLVAAGRAVIALAGRNPTVMLEHAHRLVDMNMAGEALKVADELGRQAATTGSVRLAVDLRARLGTAVHGNPATTAGLTARETQIAGFAARGLSDREIADQLVLSVRTVQTHLGRAYRKLAVTSRRDLSDALRPAG
ncbi:LuxR C-terminal-related transcriptional regulator [Micromonospora lupini]|uniref:HTH-type transcriptional regulator n=1 Tax=Micromonospora lupini str. Lupac 08 TaxID=1150864 RepID=I0KZY1_9ACTN|nr:LuxR C-terminal-related transcriptional regulator [Micromonospora lupini]CCH17128.1 HTH-type transcriptional regulator [Micromonospora lupini str. Lupac 08]